MTTTNDFQTVITSDHYAIQTNRFEPSTPAHSEILVAGATAVPQFFYHRFAKHANTAGYAVTTLDYRGIGKSAPKSLKGFKMDYLDWARQDLVAVLKEVHTQKANNKPIYMVGHSYGGHAFGLMPNHQLVNKLYTFASGAGWSGYMPFAERLKVELLWKVLGPIVTPLAGYMPGAFIGGEDLPLDVYHQWRKWCSYPNYFFDDASIQSELKHFAEVKTPITAANSDDDLWAPPASRDAFFKGYSNAPFTALTIEGRRFGNKGIGHMGYFRKGSESLWDDALAWFEKS
jgi:predicted alpha/beta hydrolase